MSHDWIKGALEARGFTMDEWLYGRSKKLRVRVLERDVIQFGLNETFDRWANSVDYWSNVPSNEGQLDRLLFNLDLEIEKNGSNSAWADEVEIGWRLSGKTKKLFKEKSK